MKKRLALAVLPFLLFHSHSTLPLRSQILTDADYVPGRFIGNNLFKEYRGCGFSRGVLKKIKDPKSLANLKEDPKLKKYKWVVQGNNYARFFKSQVKATKFLVKVCEVDNPDNLYKKGL